MSTGTSCVVPGCKADGPTIKVNVGGDVRNALCSKHRDRFRKSWGCNGDAAKWAAFIQEQQVAAGAMMPGGRLAEERPAVGQHGNDDRRGARLATDTAVLQASRNESHSNIGVRDFDAGINTRAGGDDALNGAGRTTSHTC